MHVMKTRLTFSILILCLFGCRSHNRNQSAKEGIEIDISKIAILPYDTTDTWPFENCIPADLTSDDLNEIEPIVIMCVGEYNKAHEEWYEELCAEHPETKFNKARFVIDLSKYRRQYICVTNGKGEKMVWINFLHESNFFSIDGEEDDMWKNRWKSGIIWVLDGGNQFFRLTINLTTKECCDFSVNGIA